MPDVKALPVIAELTHYPPAYDGPQGDALADLLSEVASAYATTYPADPARLDLPELILAMEALIAASTDGTAGRHAADADPASRATVIAGAAGAIAVARWLDHADAKEAAHG